MNRINARNTEISRDTLAQLAPSVFAETPMPGLSSRYQFVKTIDVVQTLEQAGYHVVGAGQAQAKTDDGRAYARHVVRLQHERHMRGPVLPGDTVPQIILRNSHNRTSAFHLSAGLFRLVCSNGLAVEAGNFTSARVLHNDPAIHDHIIEGTNLIREVTETTIAPAIERMQAKQLTSAQEREFGLAATLLKWGDAREEQVDGLLAARREEDEGRSLWNVLNRIQENAVKGGYATQNRAGRNVQARGIQAVDRDLDFNVRLWTLGARVLEAV